jgi:hypothetical protein
MLDSIHFTEILAQSKREDIERKVRRQKLLAEIDAPDTGLHARQAIAGALMRLATIIDASATGREAATAH